MADITGVVCGSYELVKVIYELRCNIESDDGTCPDFFCHIKALEAPLLQLTRQERTWLDTKTLALIQINKALTKMHALLSERMSKKRSIIGNAFNIVETYSGRFAANLTELKEELDICIKAVQLCTSVDTHSVVLDIRAHLLQSQVNVVESLYLEDPRPEDKFDRRSVLGTGTFGTTHRMINTLDNGVYAVKVIFVEDAAKAGLDKNDLTREAKILQRLNHPHIVRYFTSFFSGKERAFNMVMELIAGGSMADRIVGHPVDIATTARWLTQMVHTLIYLHNEMHMLHRDIKPENILITMDQKIKLIDLGSAKRVESKRMSKAGTDLYYSYEKANDLPYDGRDDVWAAGCVFAELMTRCRLRVRGGAIHQYRENIVNERRRRLILDCIKVNRNLGVVIARMLKPTQEKRCTAEQILELLTKRVNVPDVETEPSESDPMLVDDDDRHADEMAGLTIVSPVSSPVPRACASVTGGLYFNNLSNRFRSGSSSTSFPTRTSLKDLSERVERRQTTSWSFDSYVSSVTYSRDCTRIAACVNATEVRMYDAVSRELLWALPNVAQLRVYTISLSPDGTRLAVGAADNTVQMLDAQTGKRIFMKSVDGFVHRVCFNRDGSKFAASVGGYRYAVMNNEGTELYPPTPPPDKYPRFEASLGLCFTADGDTMIVAGNGKITVVDNVIDVRMIIKCRSVTRICITSDGSRVFAGAGSLHGNIYVYDTHPRNLEYQTPKATFKAHDNCICSMFMSADDTYFVTGSSDWTIKVWDTAVYECIQTLRGHTACVTSVRLGSNGTLISSSDDKTIRVWELLK